MNKLKYLLLSSLITLSACEVVRVVEAPTGATPPAVVQDVGFALLNDVSATITIRARWAKPITDGLGDPDWYLHTMTANKVVSGVLPTRKKVLGLADTVTIGRPAVTDTLILTSQVWSVRRNLESAKAATGKLVIMTADKAPPAPDTVLVDTIILTPIMAGVKISADEFFMAVPSDSNNIKSYNSLFIRDEKGNTTYTNNNTTFITLLKN